ncbi:MAG: hypothetical protein JWP35_2183 [Caulobacter sp.]|nr:hypothetical protein [Caulobacter sp.]
MNRRMLLLAALLLTGCASVPRIAAPAGAGFGELEPLYGVSAARDALTIRVASGGCTRKEDFAFYVDRRDGAVRLAFGRKRMDICKSFAAGHADLAFTWAELGLEPNAAVFIANPVTRFSGP